MREGCVLINRGETSARAGAPQAQCQGRPARCRAAHVQVLELRQVSPHERIAMKIVHSTAALPRHIQRNIVEAPGGCWLWTRSRSRDGYGSASFNNKTHQAHRLVYTLLRGAPPPGKQLDHICRVRHCVNPDHLDPVTNLENQKRSPLTPAGMVLCAQGHALTHDGHQRRCSICAAEYQAANREAKRQYCRDWRKRLREVRA